MKYYLKEN